MTSRPVIFEHASIQAFVAAMLAWHKTATPGFSLRRESARTGLSHTQVSRLGTGKRRLTRDLVEPLARLLALNGEERAALDRWVKLDRERGTGATVRDLPQPRLRRRGAQNHLLKDWLNVYVRDAAKLASFRPDPEYLFRLLGGIASPQRIARSLRFLLHEGFLRRGLDGKVVQNEVLVTSSDGLSSAKIRAFHQQALAIARRNIGTLPLEKRQEAALVMHLNADSVAELRQLLKEFYERLLQFADERPDDDGGLYQVLLNLTPITAGTGDSP